MLQVTRYRDRGVQAKRLGVLDPGVASRARTAACLAEVSASSRPLPRIVACTTAQYLGGPGQAVASGVAEFVAKAARVPAVRRATSAATGTRQTRAGAGRAGGATHTRRGGKSVLGINGSDPIDHVVVLMLENRSFDHMLGSLRSRVSDARRNRSRRPLGSTSIRPIYNRRYDQAPRATTTTARARSQARAGERAGRSGRTVAPAAGS